MADGIIASVDDELVLMVENNIFVYFKERFPLVGVTFVSVIFALFGLLLQKDFTGHHWILQTVCIVIVFAAFLLRQRVTDEFKDKIHDDTNFPTRPFQRGIINARQLKLLGVAALIIELSAVGLLGGPESLFWYAPVLMYSLFMAKEFFISQWLNKHFTLYFLLHEVIFIWFALWLCRITSTPIGGLSIAWAIALLCAMISIEIGRKFERRRDTKGRVVKDTYPAVWGKGSTLNILGLCMIAAGIALSYVQSSLIFAIVSATAALVLNMLPLRDQVIKVIIVGHLLLIVGMSLAL